MPSYKTPNDLAWVKNKCGSFIRITHLSSGRSAHFIGAEVKLQDVFSSEWNEEPVYGRMDPISTFKHTSRKINLSWQILNEDARVGRDNMIEIQKLISFLYPNYYNQSNNASTIAGGPILKLKFTNLVADPTNGSGLVGYADGFTFDPDFDSGYAKASGRETITTLINANLNFTVLHTHKLGWTGKKRRVGSFPYGIYSAKDANLDRKAGEAQALADAAASAQALEEYVDAQKYASSLEAQMKAEASRASFEEQFLDNLKFTDEERSGIVSAAARQLHRQQLREAGAFDNLEDKSAPEIVAGPAAAIAELNKKRLGESKGTKGTSGGGGGGGRKRGPTNNAPQEQSSSPGPPEDQSLPKRESTRGNTSPYKDGGGGYGKTSSEGGLDERAREVISTARELGYTGNDLQGAMEFRGKL